MNSSKICKKQKPKFSLNIKAVKKASKDIIEQKVNDIEDPNLSHTEKLLLVLSQDITKTETINNTKQFDNSIKEVNQKKDIKENDVNINNAEGKELKEENKVIGSEISTQNITEKEIHSGACTDENSKKVSHHIDIKKDEENKTEEKKVINDEGLLSQNEIKEGVFVIEKKTENSMKNEETINDQNCTINNTSNLEDTNDCTNNTSKNNSYTKQSSTSLNNSYSKYINIFMEKIFKEPKNNYYINHKMYDILLNEDLKNKKIPIQSRINDEFWAFLYPNDLKTYCITESGYIVNKENRPIIPLDNKDINQENGLYFCGKNIEIKTEKGVVMKKCSTNEFICKECLEKNKEIYNIKSTYLININGRVSKINKGKYHCFGHFLVNTQIEDCITNFSCEACKMLDTFSHYYN